MSITKIGPNKWKVKVSVWDRHKGYPATKQGTVTGTRSEAAVVEADFLRELQARSLTSAHASTFGEAVGIYTATLKTQGKHSDSHAALVDYVRRELGHIRLEVFADQFEQYRKHLMRTPTKQGKPRGSASVNRCTAVVNAVFNLLVDLEILARSPITKARFPALKEVPRNRRLMADEWGRLLNAIRDHRPYILPIITYMADVPCRKSELVNARREQYSPITGTIYIPTSKTGVPIHKPVFGSLREYFESIPADCPWLFYQMVSPGKYRPLTHLRYAWDYCLKKVGIFDFTIHDLRHEAATRLYEAGWDERVIMDIAGWATPMLSTYWHKDSLRSAQRITEWSRSSEAVTGPRLHSQAGSLPQSLQRVDNAAAV